MRAAILQTGIPAQCDYQFAGWMPVVESPVPSPPVNPAQQVSTGNVTVQLPAPAALPGCTDSIMAGWVGTIAAPLPPGACFEFECGKTYNVSSITLANDTKVTSVGTGPKPILIGTPSVNMFIFPPGVQRVYIGDVEVTSPWVPAVDTGSTYPYQKSSTAFGNVHGSDITLANIDLGTLNRGPALIGCQRVNLSQVNQLAPATIQSQVVYVSGVTDLTVANSAFIDSVDESSFRITSTGNAPDDGCQRMLIEGCAFKMQLDPIRGRTTNKAAFTGRSGTDWTIRNSYTSGGDFSIQWDAAGKQTITNVLIDGGIIVGARLFLAQGLTNALAQGVTVNNQTGSECVSDATAAGANITYAGIVASGPNSLLKVTGNGNPTLTGYKWSPTKTGAPVLNPNSNGSPAIIP